MTAAPSDPALGAVGHFQVVEAAAVGGRFVVMKAGDAQNFELLECDLAGGQRVEHEMDVLQGFSGLVINALGKFLNDLMDDGHEMPHVGGCADVMNVVSVEVVVKIVLSGFL